jgi:hypothetical protein
MSWSLARLFNCSPSDSKLGSFLTSQLITGYWVNKNLYKQPPAPHHFSKLYMKWTMPCDFLNSPSANQWSAVLEHHSGRRSFSTLLVFNTTKTSHICKFIWIKTFVVPLQQNDHCNKSLHGRQIQYTGTVM